MTAVAPHANEPHAAARERAGADRFAQRTLGCGGYLSLGETAMGVTPKDTIYARDTLKLYHFRPMTNEVYRTPLLFVTSLVTKPYILDLMPGQSLVEYLLRQGYDVFMLDWGSPRDENAGLGFEDYVLDYLPDCVGRVEAHTGEEEVSLVGYCLGGVLALLYQALRVDHPARNLICLATPVDFEGLPLFKRWSDKRYFDVDRLVERLGNVPPEMLQAAFDMLRPAQRTFSQLRLFDRMRDDDFVKATLMIDDWASDHIPFAGECFRQCIKELMWENNLLHERLRVAGRPVELDGIRTPVLHVMAEHDHIVPLAAGKPLVQLVGSADKRDLILKGGHVSLVAGGNALYRLWPQLDRWLAVRSL